MGNTHVHLERVPPRLDELVLARPAARLGRQRGQLDVGAAHQRLERVAQALVEGLRAARVRAWVCACVILVCCVFCGVFFTVRARVRALFYCVFCSHGVPLTVRACVRALFYCVLCSHGVPSTVCVCACVCVRYRSRNAL